MSCQWRSSCLNERLCSLIENVNDLNGNASTRLMKSIISSNRDLQRSKQQTSGRILPPPPSPVPPSPQPIGTQFALTMLGMHKNPSNSLQQHVSHTLGTLIQVQSSLSAAPVSSPNEKCLLPSSVSSSPRAAGQKSSTFESKHGSGEPNPRSHRLALSLSQMFRHRKRSNSAARSPRSVLHVDQVPYHSSPSRTAHLSLV